MTAFPLPMAALPQASLADNALVASPPTKAAGGGFGDVLNHVMGQVPGQGTPGTLKTAAVTNAGAVDDGVVAEGAVPVVGIPVAAPPVRLRVLSAPAVAPSGLPVWDPTLGSKPAAPLAVDEVELPPEQSDAPDMVPLKGVPIPIAVVVTPISGDGEAKEAAPELVAEHPEKTPALVFVPVDPVIPPLPAQRIAPPEAAPEIPAAAPGAVPAEKPQAKLALAPDAAVQLRISVAGDVPADVVRPREEPLPAPPVAREQEPVIVVPAVTKPGPVHPAEILEPERKSSARKTAILAAEPAGVEVAPKRAPDLPLSSPAAPPVRTSDPMTDSRPREVAPPLPVMKEELSPDPQPRAPLKSMSLEFSPDGAGEVHLKLAERAGEVHISVHSNDVGLNHQLRSGIGDLATALAGAGYDADAWTSSNRDNRQHREQAQPEQQARKAGPAFGAVMDQSTEEVL